MLLTITTNTHGEIKIAYFDLDFVMLKSKAGISISKQITSIKKNGIAKLKKAEKDLNAKDQKLISQKNILSKEDFAKQVKNLRKEALEYQNLRQKLIKESNDQLIKAKSELVQKLQPILTKYSQNNDLSLILQKKMVVIGKTELDVTKDILELANKEIKDIIVK
ncbi:OmpH family outer membrane protein [Candidatus Pelagibacter sp.]|nr:OmpH family outer membrane protein [Candidatus Pelagibacter sp.]